MSKTEIYPKNVFEGQNIPSLNKKEDIEQFTPEKKKEIMQSINQESLNSDWEEPYNNFSVGKCYSMFFLNVSRQRDFKVIGFTSGVWQGKDCESCEIFEFNKNQLLKKEYSTLKEIECYNCCK
jgi:hypothetical protein